jgi:hypothetical protein
MNVAPENYPGFPRKLYARKKQRRAAGRAGSSACYIHIRRAPREARCRLCDVLCMTHNPQDQQASTIHIILTESYIEEG